MSKMRKAVIRLLLLLASHTSCVAAPTTDWESFGIREYLARVLIAASNNGKMFASYKVLDTKEDSQTITLYLWAVTQEYYKHKKHLLKGSGCSEPVVVIVNKLQGKPVSYEVPRSGSFYTPDLERMFSSKAFRTPFFSSSVDQKNAEINKLEQDIGGRAERIMGLSAVSP